MCKYLSWWFIYENLKTLMLRRWVFLQMEYYTFLIYRTLYFSWPLKLYWLCLIIHWKDWCWSWNSNTLATWYEELTHFKRPWCWERLKAGGWDGWRASLTQWTWVWVNSRSWWWTGRPGGLQSMGLQRIGHNWGTELNWMSN